MSPESQPITTMRNRSSFTDVHKGLAILAGAFSFAGSIGAATLLSENFDGAGNLFSAPTYAYSLNYTLANLLTPGGGLKYMHGGNGANGSVSTNFFTASTSPLSLLTGGITAGAIDASSVSYDLYAQFSSYRAQGDYGTVRVRFLDGTSTPLGSYITVGSSALVSSLGTGVDGSRAWAADSTTGLVPVGARFAQLDIQEVKGPEGVVIDAYVDNVNFNIVVPEPNPSALLALGGSLLWFVRRRR